jgi:hypothetical protein
MIELAEYAFTARIDKESAFQWWVRQTLRIIKKVKTKYWKRTQKFGIKSPKGVKQTLAIDKNKGTTFWRVAIDKEMKNNFSMTTLCRLVSSRSTVTRYLISKPNIY